MTLFLDNFLQLWLRRILAAALRAWWVQHGACQVAVSWGRSFQSDLFLPLQHRCKEPFAVGIGVGHSLETGNCMGGF